MVLPDSTDDFLLLRPLGGSDQEIARVYLPLESADVKSASFALPDPTQVGDFISGRLLRDAKLYEIGAGTSEIRRMLIGRELFNATK